MRRNDATRCGAPTAVLSFAWSPDYDAKCNLVSQAVDPSLLVDGSFNSIRTLLCVPRVGRMGVPFEAITRLTAG